MSDIELYNIPQSELYWRKEQLSDQIFSLSRRLQRVKNPQTIANYHAEIIYLHNSINKIDSRMESLYM